LASENQSLFATVRRYLRDPMFIHFGTVPACVRRTDRQADRQTDRQTDGHVTTPYTALAKPRAVKTSTYFAVGKASLTWKSPTS